MPEIHLQTTNLDSTFKALRSRDPSKLSKSSIPRHGDYKSIPRQNFAPCSSAHTGSWGNGMARFASTASAGTIYGQPQFFSPVHTPINWQIPSKRLEIYQWSRFFYENEPKVAASIDFYSYFPMSDWEHECRDREVKNYFDEFKKRLSLPKWCRMISHEVHLLGDCFPFAEISCEHCHGSGMIGDELCDHEGGTVRRMIILNPDFVDVHSGALDPEPIIALRPDEELINMVQRKTPGHERLSPEVISLVSSGQPIRLDNKCVAHLKYGECGYNRYGIGMVRRLFPILSYKTKLMVAQWIVAERLIVPIKIVKVGSDERPAGPADIAAVQAQLAETANDPNLTIVTHHAFELMWEGATGKVLTLSNEFEFINQEVLDGMMINNALLNGEGPNFTHSDDTRLLTNNGLKYRTEFDIETDLVATFNVHTKELEYQKATKKFEYDWNSIDGDDPPLKRFLTNRVDMLVTPNHRMLCANRKLTTGPNGQKVDGQKEGFGEWEVVRAAHVKPRCKFRACVDHWNATEKDQETYFDIPTDDFLKIVGWYVSEGYKPVKTHQDGSQHVHKVTFSQCPSANPKIYDKMEKVLSSNSLLKTWGKNNNVFVIEKSANEKLVEYLDENCGGYANTKCIPKNIKNMSKKNLSVLLGALVEGDGNERPATKKKPTKKKYYSYTTVSTQLRDDVIEILFKLGFSPRFSKIEFDNPNHQTQYTISWSENTIGRFPKLASRDMTVSPQQSKQVIFDEDYVGKVWCVEVPNHFIVTERNGLFGIHGNSAAAVGIEAMIQRLNTFRNSIAEWIEEFLYLPEAKRQGFIDVNPETNEEEYLTPKIKWNSMHLRDQQQYRTFIIQLYEKGLVSAQTVLEAFEIDPDQEIERKRYDAVQMLALGQGVGGGQGGMGDGFGGGGMGGMGDMGMGGGMDGGMGGDPPIGAPGGDMMGGGAPPSPTGGGPVLAKSTSLTADTVDPSQFGGKVLKKKTRDKMESELTQIYNKQEKAKSTQQDANGQIRDEKGRITYTKLERVLIDHIIQYQNSF